MLSGTTAPPEPLQVDIINDSSSGWVALVVGAIPSLVIALAVVYLGHRFTLRQAERERTAARQAASTERDQLRIDEYDRWLREQRRDVYARYQATLFAVTIGASQRLTLIADSEPHPDDDRNQATRWSPTDEMLVEYTMRLHRDYTEMLAVASDEYVVLATSIQPAVLKLLSLENARSPASARDALAECTIRASDVVDPLTTQMRTELGEPRVAPAVGGSRDRATA